MKSKLSILMLGFALSVLLAACGSNDAKEEEKPDTGSKTEASASEGEELYQQSCVGCHGKDLEGMSGPNLQEVGGKYDEDKIKNIIKNGRGNMPKGLVDDKEAAVIAKWLSEKK
ncbi:cytochrome c551 [Bacillus vallismortis]|uniref:cytochrome c551 n=1 Tax=Bacillus vallismortis TaxID=72361 RepID=UPI0022827D47|nr:cytochrome c [Bacillus vallismortis]MCY8533763.1 cytochrome c [Bacillus vallismortis]MCY8544286.1 cytochrome c [Bacillus vallismortis]